MSIKSFFQQVAKRATLIKPTRIQGWFLVVLLLLVLLVKIYFVLQTPFPAYDSYYGIRQVDHIHKTGLPFIIDELSYQGRITYEGIFFYLFVAGIALFMPTILFFKYASILFSLGVLFLVYKIVQRLVKDRWIALLTTTIAALSPSIFTSHLNTLLPSSLFSLLYLMLIYFFFTSHKRKHISWFVIFLVLSMLVSSLIFIFVAGFAIYMLLLKLESLQVRRREVELLLFSSVLVIWFHLLLYRPLFLDYGASVIWKTMPKELVASTFQGLTVPLAISLVGIIPLLLGMYAIYATLFVKRSRNHLFLTSLAFVFGMATWFGFLPLVEGLFYTTLTFTLLCGPALKLIQEFIKRTRFFKAKPLFLIALFVLLIVNFLPVFIYQPIIVAQAPSTEEVTVFSSLAEQLPDDATVLAHITEGHLITALTQRKNFYDTNFILAPQAQQRYDDAKKVFLSQSQTAIISTLQAYGVTHVLITPLTIEEYPKVNETFEESDCFLPVYSWKNVTAYEITCQLKN